jgi:hypothetical protein
MDEAVMYDFRITLVQCFIQLLITEDLWCIYSDMLHVNERIKTELSKYDVHCTLLKQ